MPVHGLINARVDTKLSPFVSTDLFHLTGTRHVTALGLCGFLFFVWVVFCLCLCFVSCCFCFWFFVFRFLFFDDVTME